jgi:hypothetical protein
MAKITPWGAAQTSKSYGEGITFYSTAGHGGFYVTPKLNALIPEYFRLGAWSNGAKGWYEEDCDWAIVVVVFPERFTPEDVAAAKDLLAHYLPDQYEKFFNVVLQPGESRAKDERAFLAEHANDLLGRGAFGDWHAKVPKGMVGVCASKPGSKEERFFLVPEADYKFKFSFVINPEIHQEVGAF